MCRTVQDIYTSLIRPSIHPFIHLFILPFIHYFIHPSFFIHLFKVIKGVSDNADLTWADDMIYTIEQHIEAMRRDSQPDPNLLANTYQRREPLKDGKHGLCFVNRTFLS